MLLHIPFGGECWSKAQPYRDQNQQFALCFDESSFVWSHVIAIALTQTILNHRALGIRPRSLLWLARVTGLFKNPPPTYRMDSEERDNKQKSRLLLRPVIATFFKGLRRMSKRLQHVGYHDNGSNYAAFKAFVKSLSFCRTFSGIGAARSLSFSIFSKAGSLKLIETFTVTSGTSAPSQRI